MSRAGSALRPLVVPVYIPSLAHGIGMTALLPVLPLMALSLGFSIPQAAALTLISGVVGVLGPVPVGQLMVRVGERASMVVTGVGLVLVNLAGFGLLAHADNHDPSSWHRIGLVAVLVCMALAEQVWVLGRQAYLATHLAPQFRPRGMSTFGGMFRIGSVLGPLLGAAVIAVADLHFVFLVDAVAMTLATALVAWRMLPGDRNRRPPLRGGPAIPVLKWSHWEAVVKVGLAVLPLTMGRVNRPLILPLLGAALGVDAATISLIFGVSAFLEILMFVPAGTVMERYGRTFVLLTCLLGTGVGYVGMAVLVWTVPLAGTGAIVVLAVSSVLIALGNGMGAGIVMTLGIDIAPEEDRTRHLARWNAMVGAGRLAGPGVVTVITALSTLAMAGFVTGIISLGLVPWLLRVLPSRTPRPQRGPWAHDRSGS